MRHALTLAAAIVLTPLTAFAEPRALDATEISALLSDRTIDGTWNGRPYRQRFDGTGWTLYEPEGGPAEQGKWRVNTETDQYESWWERSGWSSYAILENDGAYFWAGSSGQAQPFSVRPAN